MSKYNMFGGILENKKAVHISGYDIPLGIYWLDNIDYGELERGILECSFYFLSGKHSNLKTRNSQLEIRIFKYDIKPTELCEIREAFKQNISDFDLLHTVCYWAAKQAMDIKIESDRIKTNMENIDNSKIKYIENESQSILNIDMLCMYLKNSKDVCTKHLTHIGFINPYNGNGPFGKKYEDLGWFETEMGTVIEKAVKSSLNDPKYKDMLKRFEEYQANRNHME